MKPGKWRVAIIEVRGSSLVFSSRYINSYEYETLDEATQKLTVTYLHGAQRSYIIKNGIHRVHIYPNSDGQVETLEQYMHWVENMRDKW